MKKILLFSSICKPKSILEISLVSYIKLFKENFEIDFLFYDDNIDFESSNYLNTFCKEHSNCFLMPAIQLPKSDYQDHNWNPSRIDRIICIKNNAIQKALDNNYDYLFLVDSDLVLHPSTLIHLVSQKEHFIFEIFWTLFYEENYHKPNAWDFHSWAYYSPETILKLSEKGKYKVGGGGACTLLSKGILEKGLNFNRLFSLNFQGEDRHFCTKAQALGFDVVVDTHYPAYHIFDEKQIIEAFVWYDNGANPDFFKKWLNNNWRLKVLQSFEKRDGNLLYKIKIFQYEIRKSFKKIFFNN